MKRSIRWAVYALTLLLILPAARAQDVMQQVPAEALVVIRVKNLEQASQKFAKFANELGLAQMQPEFGDPLAALRKQSGIQQGLNAGGDLAIVLLDPAVKGGDQPAPQPADDMNAMDEDAEFADEDEPAMLVLIPVSDYQAFLKNFQDQQTEGQITQVTMPEDQETGYVAQWGKYAALSPSRQAVELKPAGVQPQGAVAKEVQTKDMVVYLNLPRLREIVLEKIDENREEILSGMESAFTQTRPDMAGNAAIRALGEQLLGFVETFFNEAVGASFGLNLTDAGISTTVMLDFKPESRFAGVMKSFKNSDESLLSGIPAAKYLFLGGAVNDPQAMNKLIADFLDPMAKQLKEAMGDESGAIDRYVQSLKNYYSAAQRSSFGMIAPTGELGQAPLIQFVANIRGDAQKLQSSYNEMLKAQQELTSAVGTAPQSETTVTPKAKTLDGVSFDLATTEINADPQSPEAAQAQQAIMFMYGPEGVNVLSGAVDDKTLLVASGLDDPTLKQAIAAAKKDEDPLGKLQQIQSVREQLPRSRIAAMYVPVDEIVSTALAYAGKMGFPIPLQLPPDLPPFGATIATEGSALRIDSHTPMELVRSLVAAGMQMQMQMGGQQRGGNL